MDPRFQMVLQPGQTIPPQQGQMMAGGPRMGLQPGQQRPPVSGAPSPLLAQQLSQQQQQQSQQQSHQPEEEMNALDNVQNDLQDLGVPDEDLLGMAEEFNILEFADALDESDTNKTNILDDLQAEDEAAAADVEKVAKEEAKSSGPAGSGPAGPPPPYTATGPTQGQQAGPSRGPPPPYPGAQGQGPNKVRKDFICKSKIGLFLDPVRINRVCSEEKSKVNRQKVK